MFAFIRVGSCLAKAYDMGTDWQIITSDGNEYWFSVWQANKKASLYTAFCKACKLDSVVFNDKEVTIV